MIIGVQTNRKLTGSNPQRNTRLPFLLFVVVPVIVNPFPSSWRVPATRTARTDTLESLFRDISGVTRCQTLKIFQVLRISNFQAWKSVKPLMLNLRASLCLVMDRTDFHTKRTSFLFVSLSSKTRCLTFS